MDNRKEDTKVQDIVEIDISKDGDVCDQKELNSLYQHPYYCSARKAVGLDKLYVLHLDCQWETKKLAAALSNNSIHLTSTNSLEKISTFIAHEQNIVDIHFNPTDHNCLLSASSDGSIRAWDVRNPQKHTHEFIDDTDQRMKPLMSFDINCEGRYLCGGTEQVKKDSFLFLWDMRSSKVLKKYTEFHEDDVSHVQFHPTSANMLASCSTDSLINIFDINQEDEDDALQFSLNAETSCARLQWLRFDKKAKQESISVITHTEEVQIWDVEEATPKHTFTREIIAGALKRKKTETCYAIRVFNTGEKNALVLAGSNTPERGCLRMLEMRKGKLEPYAILYDQKGGHSQMSQTIRGAALNPANGQIVTGGEDGIINVWIPGEEKYSNATNLMVEVPTKKAHKDRANARKPYAK